MSGRCRRGRWVPGSRTKIFQERTQRILYRERKRTIWQIDAHRPTVKRSAIKLCWSIWTVVMSSSVALWTQVSEHFRKRKANPSGFDVTSCSLRVTSAPREGSCRKGRGEAGEGGGGGRGGRGGSERKRKSEEEGNLPHENFGVQPYVVIPSPCQSEALARLYAPFSPRDTPCK